MSRKVIPIQELGAELVQSLARPTRSVLGLEPGLYPDIPGEDYHARELGIASCSALDVLEDSPASLLCWLEGFDDETPAKAFGNVVHRALLEPQLPLPKLSAKERETCQGILHSVTSHPLASTLLLGGLAELTLRWDDPLTGLPCKARADKYQEELRTVVDVKTTRNAGPEGFRRAVAEYRYHRRTAFYRDGFEVLGVPVDHFVLIAVEKTPPYLVGLYELAPEAVAVGRESYRRLLRTYADCLKTGRWPGLEERILTLDLPPWVTA